MNQSRRDLLKALCLLPFTKSLPSVPVVGELNAMIGVPRMLPVYQQIQQICESLGIPYRVFIGE